MKKFFVATFCFIALLTTDFIYAQEDLPECDVLTNARPLLSAEKFFSALYQNPKVCSTEYVNKIRLGFYCVAKMNQDCTAGCGKIIYAGDDKKNPTVLDKCQYKLDVAQSKLIAAAKNADEQGISGMFTSSIERERLEQELKATVDKILADNRIGSAPGTVTAAGGGATTGAFTPPSTPSGGASRGATPATPATRAPSIQPPPVPASGGGASPPQPPPGSPQAQACAADQETVLREALIKDLVAKEGLSKEEATEGANELIDLLKIIKKAFPNIEREFGCITNKEQLDLAFKSLNDEKLIELITGGYIDPTSLDSATLARLQRRTGIQISPENLAKLKVALARTSGDSLFGQMQKLLKGSGMGMPSGGGFGGGGSSRGGSSSRSPFAPFSYPQNTFTQQPTPSDRLLQFLNPAVPSSPIPQIEYTMVGLIIANPKDVVIGKPIVVSWASVGTSGASCAVTHTNASRKISSSKEGSVVIDTKVLGSGTHSFVFKCTSQSGKVLEKKAEVVVR